MDLFGRFSTTSAAVNANAGVAGVGTGVYAMTQVPADSPYAFGNQLLNVSSITLGVIDTTLNSGEALLPTFRYPSLGLSEAAGPIGLGIGVANDVGGVYVGLSNANYKQYNDSLVDAATIVLQPCNIGGSAATPDDVRTA